MKYLFSIVSMLITINSVGAAPVIERLPIEVGLLHLGMPLQVVRALLPSAEGIGGEGCYEVLFDSGDLEAVFPVNIRRTVAYMHFDGDQADARLIYLQIPVTDDVARRLAATYAPALSGIVKPPSDDRVPREWSSSSTIVRLRLGDNAVLSLESADAEDLCARELTFPRS